MRQRTKTFIFIFLFALLWIPLLQQFTKYFKEPQLNGAYIKPGLPDFSIDSLNTLRFKKDLEKYENSNLGFRAAAVKIKNTLNYLLFKELSVKNNFIGKDGYIFQTESTEQTLGISYGPKERYQAAIEETKFLKETLEQRGIHFLVVI